MPRVSALRLSFCAGLALFAGIATAFQAHAQPAAPPIGYRSSDSSVGTWSFREDPFRTTLAPFSDQAPSQRDVPPDETEDKTQLKHWTLALEAYTHAPVDLGGGVLFETPFGLRLGTGFGWIPSAYVDFVSNVAASAGGYDSTTGTEVRDGIDGGTVWRSHLGIRPIGGFYLDGGYALVRLNGSLSAAEVAPGAGVQLAGTGLETASYDIHSTIHMWIAEVGWQSHVGRHVLLGVGVGVMGTISASTRADPNFALGTTPMAMALSQSSTDSVDQTVQRYGFVPTLHARMGFDLL